MLRRIFSVILMICVITLGSAALFACGDKPEDGQTDENGAAAENTGETPAEATPEPETPEPTDPAPRKINKWIEFSDETDPSERNAVKVGDGGGFNSIGVKFTADFIMTGIAISCPSWSDDIGTMIFKIYKWDTDYETTTAGDPVFIDAETFVDYPDNALVETVFDPEIEPGTYLWELSEGKDGVGVWASKTPGADGLEFYRNGQLFTDGTAFNAELTGYVMSE